jgi:FtsH-binding integral membrane protein
MFNSEGPSLKSVFTLSDISEKTQAHLTKVYTMILACSFVCALGMYVNATLILSGFFMTILSIILSVYLMVQVNNRSHPEQTRMLYLAALAFQLGYLVGPAIHHIADVNPGLLIQASLYTGMAFTSFSAISLFSKRRSMLFLGGIIMTVIQCMMLYRLVSWISGYGSFGFTYILCGLLVACLYIIYDTQVIIERAERGDKDVPTHTMMLFIDLFDLFIKIVRILQKLQDNKDNERRRKN